jgi:hypothetical protein
MPCGSSQQIHFRLSLKERVTKPGAAASAWLTRRATQRSWVASAKMTRPPTDGLAGGAHIL